ncbi:phosphatidylglycerophosphatase A [Zhengella mangrovi]|uniref:Phosphatidylglycerophosphatase A n=1 Tax=Zhengella mangrovi TaxID=1982044 RepID=A0A2G1QJL5_9HYPH|nr:phosphatidylglycerophosphatase A [Zhengella mangrovi]PHP65651.1 phosphatidylglycerophosphatase A [Zhengella mangrovi]
MSAHSREPTFREMVRRPHQAIALAFGLGLSPYAPGTAGALGAIPLFWALSFLPLPIQLAVLAALIAIASWASGKTGDDLGEHDHNAIVIDETIGMALTLLVAPASWTGWLAALILFRVFDIVKPWPVHIPDRQGTSGFAVILDDILAAGWAMLILAGWHVLATRWPASALGM